MHAPHDIGFDPAQFLNSLDPFVVGAARSKLVAASIGDIVVVLSRSSAHKHYSLADIEWMVMPPVTTGQFYVVETVDKERGFRAPVAVVTWAFVSEEVDQLLREQATPLPRLRPDEWKNGAIGWLIDAAGDPVGVRTALQWLSAGPFKERPLKIIVRGEGGAAKVATLGALLTDAAEASTTVCR
jgi:hemolysin-activating ACP:hemolysin acyltransferase